MTHEEQLRRIGQQLLALGYAHTIMVLVKPTGQMTMLADHKQQLNQTQSAQLCYGVLELAVKQLAPRQVEVANAAP